MFRRVAAVIAVCTSSGYAAAGTTAASFLQIPVGAGPASLGGAYTALATDAYAPVWNPAGLGFLESSELAGQHVSYLETAHDEFASFVVPLRRGSALGTSLQYLGTGDIASTDNSGASLGNFSSHYAAFNLSYGQALCDQLSLGATAKWINSRLGDVSANAYAFDAGAFLKAARGLDFAVVVANAGSRLKYLSQSDSLPLEVRFGGAGQLPYHFVFAAEGVARPNDVSAGHFGVEWSPAEIVALRAGYRTDTTKELSAMAGMTAGVGLRLWGEEFAYAWTPMGDLGDVHYFSLVLRFGSAHSERRNLIRYHAAPTTVKNGNTLESADLSSLPWLDEPRVAQAQQR